MSSISNITRKYKVAGMESKNTSGKDAGGDRVIKIHFGAAKGENDSGPGEGSVPKSEATKSDLTRQLLAALAALGTNSGERSSATGASSVKISDLKALLDIVETLSQRSQRLLRDTNSLVEILKVEISDLRTLSNGVRRSLNHLNSRLSAQRR